MLRFDKFSCIWLAGLKLLHGLVLISCAYEDGGLRFDHCFIPVFDD